MFPKRGLTNLSRSNRLNSWENPITCIASCMKLQQSHHQHVVQGKMLKRLTKELTRLFASLMSLHHFSQCLGVQSTHFLWRCELAIEQLESWFRLGKKKLLSIQNENAKNTAGIFKIFTTFVFIPSSCPPVNKILFKKMLGFPRMVKWYTWTLYSHGVFCSRNLNHAVLFCRTHDLKFLVRLTSYVKESLECYTFFSDIRHVVGNDAPIPHLTRVFQSIFW